MLCGAWVLSSEWLGACLRAGAIVDESPYEVHRDVKSSSDNGGGPKRARLHKEQAGRRPLLHSRRIFLWGKFEQRSGCIPKAELSTLLRAAGASVCDRLPTEIDMRQARDER